MPTVVTKRMRRKKNGSGWWREDQKIEAVAQYLLLGKMTEVSRVTGIPRETLYKWKATDFWTNTEADIRKQTSQELQGKLGKIVEKSLKVVEDRLDRGDFVYDPKSGSIKRIGVRASVANQITKDAIDRKILLEKLSNKGSNSEEAVAVRLASLKEEFLKFVKAKAVDVEEVKPVLEVKPTIEVTTNA